MMKFAANILASLCLLLSLGLIGCTTLAYRHMNDPARDAWQKPEGVVETLAITPGSRVTDLGAGGGYFTWHLAGAVGPGGTVYAVDINDTALTIQIDADDEADESGSEAENDATATLR